MSLYQYAGFKKDTALLPDAKRLMLRAYEKSEGLRLLIALAMVCFDIGKAAG